MKTRWTMRIHLLVTLAALALAGASALSQPSSASSISFQGTLNGTNGLPLEDQTTPLTKSELETIRETAKKTNTGNTALGSGALFHHKGVGNTAVGEDALFSNESGGGNTALGYGTGFYITTGDENILLGQYAGANITTGSSNIDIGNEGISTDTNIIRIGSGQTSTYIAGVINGNGAGLTNLTILGEKNATLQNFYGSGENAVVYDLVHGPDDYSGFGSAIGANISSPVIWFYQDAYNQFQVRSRPYGEPLDNSALLMALSDNGNMTLYGTGSSLPTLTVEGIAQINPTGGYAPGDPPSLLTSGLIQALYVSATAMYADSFVNTSDRNSKTNIVALSSPEILEKVVALPVYSWSFTNAPEEVHVGPMAQDFYAAFKLGMDDKHIGTIDEGGVALAAIQGLNQKLEETRGENAVLKQQNDALAERLNELEAAFRLLAERK